MQELVISEEVQTVIPKFIKLTTEKASPKLVIKPIKKSKRYSIMEPCLPSNIAKNIKNTINIKLVKAKMKCSLLTTFATS
jgi:hypothetical protein